MRITPKPPQTVADLDAFTWRDILARLRGISAKVPSGAASVRLHLLVCEGEPVQWFEPEIRRLEPRRAAREFVESVEGEAKA